MNIWRIALKELLTLRDVKMLVFMIATPVLLVLILGTIVANGFHGSVAVGEIRVLYTNHSQEPILADSWNRFVEQSGRSGIAFERVRASADGKLEVENNRYVGYVEISDTGIKYYGNSRSRVESDIAQSMITAFEDRYRLASAVAKEDPEQAGVLLSGGESTDHVSETSVNGARQPGATDYYAIAMITLIVLYGAMTAAQLIETERKRRTAVRLLASPVTKAEIFAGKVAGNLLQNAIYILVVVLICKYMFNVYWGEHLGLVFLVLLSEIVFALSLGLGFSYIFREKAAGSILMMIIQVGAFVGGSYFPVDALSGFMRTVADFSPLEWTNDALLQIIYADHAAAAVQAISLNIGFSVLLLVAALLIMKRREGL
ncbi:ABC transporter permease [Cohnella pontilimi]|uniref:ABC transporter permease n=1 Tax=Cohnella pontilimi TaxID=2564100 RepID=A0A4U0F4X5_9BACL|nr:ABC transporter permease [Cohnella pontilimi]TJY39623.1 ABC transporter permease [Cohnella pontilimi]